MAVRSLGCTPKAFKALTRSETFAPARTDCPVPPKSRNYGLKLSENCLLPEITQRSRLLVEPKSALNGLSLGAGSSFGAWIAVIEPPSSNS